MSTYCTIDGTIHYGDQGACDRAIHHLHHKGWLDGKERFISEYGAGPIVDQSTVDRNAKSIYIPLGCYRNLGAHLNELLVGSNTNYIVWGTTDGAYQGGVIKDGVETLYDLEKWAKEPEQVEELGEWIDDIEFVNGVVDLFMETFID